MKQLLSTESCLFNDAVRILGYTPLDARMINEFDSVRNEAVLSKTTKYLSQVG